MKFFITSVLAMLTFSAHAYDVYPIVTKSSLSGEMSDASAVKIDNEFYVTNCHTLVNKSQVIVMQKTKVFFSHVYFASDLDLCFFGSNVHSFGTQPIVNGEQVRVIGFTKDETVWETSGIVSTLDDKTFKINTPWREGVSGGAVLNMRGELVGISTYISQDRSYGVAVSFGENTFQNLPLTSIRNITYKNISFYANKLVLNK